VTQSLLRDELLPAGPDDADWRDVVRRAGLARQRGAFALGALLAAALLGLASAWALGHPVVDFGSAPKGSRQVVNAFGSLEVGAPAGMAPGVLPRQARRVTSVRIDGKRHVLWVAPTKRGGFCAEWTGLGGGCRADRHGRVAQRLEVSGGGDARGLRVISGSFFQPRGERLLLRYADGQTVDIPFVWVTAPINAGFYAFAVPAAHRPRSHAPERLTLVDGSGKALAREPVLFARAPAFVLHRVPGFGPLTVPAQAEWARRRQLFDLRADDGARIGLWVAPERGGGRCFWANRAAGCSRGPGRRRAPATPPLQLGIQGGGRVLLCCSVSGAVATVQARFQDGERVSLAPREGFLIWPIPTRHYARGRRLSMLVAYDGRGRVLQQQRFRSTPGVYPCAKPRSYGYGVKQCP
jgi:hypothetical protein